ncbi:hypothetical protein BHE86_13920 [Shigella sp. FC1655]|nr:hypothetical protein BGK50_14925 [Shigella sp. FC130]OEI95239.1 hypothetical protein BHE86_13920 [Shigella sp. FC1655]
MSQLEKAVRISRYQHKVRAFFLVLLKKKANGKKIEINTCANPRSPYNAHPLTDDELTTATKDSEEKRKKFEKTLDSSEE